MRIQSTVVNPEIVWYGRLTDMVRRCGIKIGNRRAPVSVALGYHSQQCGQRWWGIRIGKCRLAYRTRGDASPKLATYEDAGFWWPWQAERTASGFYL